MFDFINLTLQEFIRKFNCEDVCLSYLEKRFWNNVPVSPFDPSSKVYNYGNDVFYMQIDNQYANKISPQKNEVPQGQKRDKKIRPSSAWDTNEGQNLPKFT